jgi:cyclase
MQEVAPGVYAETKYPSGNVGLIRTGEGVICVDVPTLPDDVHDWQSQIRQVTREPFLFLIQTDYDENRVVSTFMLNAPLIVHRAAWEKMSKLYSRANQIQRIEELLGLADTDAEWHVRMPDITFSYRLILYKGTREVHILHGGGHSPATCMVYLPQDRLVFSGDVVYNNAHPQMEQAQSKAWLAALNRLRKMAVDTIIPGHGPVCDLDATYRLSDYLRAMRAHVRQSFNEGRSKSETARSVIPEFIGAFPHREEERPAVRQLIKGGSDRIYDEYRDATRRRGKKQKREKEP